MNVPGNITPLPSQQPQRPAPEIPNKPNLMKWQFEMKLKGQQQSLSGVATADTLLHAVMKLFSTMADKQQEFDGIMVSLMATEGGIILPH